METAELIERVMSAPRLSHDERVRRNVEQYNNTPGKLTGYDCPDCLNRGNFEIIVDCAQGITAIKFCRCMAIRKSLRQLELSGLKDNMKRYRFDNYETTDEWQKDAYNMAQAFVNGEQRRGFFAGGQVGGGKTHLCTAISSELLREGMALRYMVWDVEAKRLKAMLNDDERYENAMRGWREVDALYIDDFLKVRRGTQPTDADIKLAFEIINYRYNNSGLITIVSSEHVMNEIMDFDEATGGRIYELSKGYCLNIDRSKDKNYRLRGCGG